MQEAAPASQVEHENALSASTMGTNVQMFGSTHSAYSPKRLSHTQRNRHTQRQTYAKPCTYTDVHRHTQTWQRKSSSTRRMRTFALALRGCRLLTVHMTKTETETETDAGDCGRGRGRGRGREQQGRNETWESATKVPFFTDHGASRCAYMVAELIRTSSLASSPGLSSGRSGFQLRSFQTRHIHVCRGIEK